MTPIEPVSDNDPCTFEISKLERELLETRSEIGIINQRRELKEVEAKTIRNEIEHIINFGSLRDLNDDGHCVECGG